jgi:hypothetical protein
MLARFSTPMVKLKARETKEFKNLPWYHGRNRTHMQSTKSLLS